MHPAKHGLHGIVGIGPLNAAALVGQGNEVVAARGEEPADGLAVYVGHGIGAFVAVGERFVHSPYWRHLYG